MPLSTVHDMASLDVPSDFIDAAIAVLAEQAERPLDDYPLTKLQTAALSDQRVHTEANLIISGPTSAGKTLVAYALIALALDQGSQILYLVPLRALVEEKATELRALFPGRRILLASSDHPRADHAVLHDGWDIVVAVYEKVYQWFASLACTQRLLGRAWMCVVDELHVLGDKERGDRLEMILGTLCWHQREIAGPVRRIVGLCAMPEVIQPVAEWLRAVVLPAEPTPRPVRIIEGYVTRAVCFPKELPFPLRLPGLGGNDDDDKRWVNDVLIQLADNGLRVLVYVASRRGSEERALQIKNQRRTSSAQHDYRRALESLEFSPTTESLIKAASGRVAFHNRDLTPEERQVVEQTFRRARDSGLDIVVATRTLSMGINLAADVVVLLDQHTYAQHGDGARGDGAHVPLSVLDYRNYAGRAGRLRPNLPADYAGVCLLALEPRQQQPTFNEARNLPHRRAEDIASCLRPDTLVPHMLLLLAVARVRPGMPATGIARRIIAESYGARDSKRREELVIAMEVTLDWLRNRGLLVGDELSRPGEVLAQTYLDKEAAETLLAIARDTDFTRPFPRFELLVQLARLARLERAIFRSPHVLLGDIARVIRRVVPPASYAAAGATAAALDAARAPGKAATLDASVLERALFLWCWHEGVSLNHYHQRVMHGRGMRVSLATARSIGEAAADMVLALRGLLACRVDLDADEMRDRTDELLLFCASLRFGVPLEIADLALRLSLKTGRRPNRDMLNLFHRWKRSGASKEQPWFLDPEAHTLYTEAAEEIQAQDALGRLGRGEAAQRMRMGGSDGDELRSSLDDGEVRRLVRWARRAVENVGDDPVQVRHFALGRLEAMGCKVYVDRAASPASFRAGWNQDEETVDFHAALDRPRGPYAPKGAVVIMHTVPAGAPQPAEQTAAGPVRLVIGSDGLAALVRLAQDNPRLSPTVWRLFAKHSGNLSKPSTVLKELADMMDRPEKGEP